MKSKEIHRALVLSFLVAFVTLATQILVYRVVSAKLLNNYAFLVISLTMLGFAFSGVVLSRLLTSFLASLNNAVNLCASLFAVSLLTCTVVFYKIPVGSQLAVARADFIPSFLLHMPLALLYAVPFAFCGLILGTLLSSKEFPTRRVYFSDLVGSALGAVVVLPNITHFGVEKSILVCSGLLTIGTFVLFPPKQKIVSVLSTISVLVLVLSFIFQGKVFEMNYPEGSMLAESKKWNGWLSIEHVSWDPVARIEVSRFNGNIFDPDTFSRPSVVGGNPAFHAKIKRMLTQNNWAFTLALEYDGNKESLRGIEETIFSIAYHATSVPNPKVVVIGPGGGMDILTAIFFDASEITGVEVNLATVQILRQTYRDYFRNFVEDPRVNLINAEGRYFLSKSDQEFDIIQLSGVDTYAGTAACANIFSESYLYTKEAMSLFFSRLTKNGIINLTRLEFSFPRELLRVLTTTVAALREEGVDEPAKHIVMMSDRNKNGGAMLVKKTPFTASELSRLEKWAKENPYLYLSAGRGFTDRPDSFYQTFLELNDPVKEKAWAAAYPLDIRPVGDDRPFFFRYSYWRHLFSKNPLRRIINPALEYSLIILFGLIVIAALLCIYLPLRILSRRVERPKGIWRYGFLFSSIGLGYLAVEIALMQKFGLFLGHPNYAISTVLAALLFATGLGSLYSEWIVQTFVKPMYVSLAFAVIVLAELFIIFPLLAPLTTLAFSLKASMVFLLILPIGLLLGTFMPSALERLKLFAPPFVPWAWGINGIFSVLAPILCIALSATWGISALLISAIPIYLFAGVVFPSE